MSNVFYGFDRSSRLLRDVVIATAIVVGPLCSLARAQTPPAPQAIPSYRFRLLGVYDQATGEPVEGAEVIDVLGKAKAATTKTGTVSLFFLPDGGSLVRVRKVGYEPQTFMVPIDSMHRGPLTILLVPANVATLPTVHVTDTAGQPLTPLLRAFEEHRKKGYGHFVDESEFRKNDEKTMADLLLSRMPGLQPVHTSTGATLFVSTRTMCKGGALARCTEPNCFVTTYIDGIRVFDAGMGASAAADMDRLSAIDFAAAEFYPGGAVLPAEYPPTNSQCGTLLLYTRAR